MTRLTLAVILFVTSIPVALAQGSPQERQACTRDAQRLCRQNLGDDGAIVQDSAVAKKLHVKATEVMISKP